MTDCLCCKKGQNFERPHVCPLCGQTFAYKWLGIDGHWRSKITGHEAIMPYKEFWDSLCPYHKK